MRRGSGLPLALVGSMAMLFAITVLVAVQGERNTPAAGGVIASSENQAPTCSLLSTSQATLPSAGTSIDVAASLPAGFNAPPGFLTPAYIPAGYRLTGFEQARQGEAIVRISRSYENSEKEGLHFSESLRPSGLSKTDTAGVPVQFAGAIAYCSSFTLTFASGNLVVGITAPELSLDEVVRVADSMR